MHTRYRQCNNPSPKNGGRRCSGSSSENSSCNTNGCPGMDAKNIFNVPMNKYLIIGLTLIIITYKLIQSVFICNIVNGNWGNWGSYGSCSKTCGGGMYTRYRQCNNPSQKNGGRPCSGSSSETSPCQTNGCPGMNAVNNMKWQK